LDPNGAGSTVTILSRFAEGVEDDVAAVLFRLTLFDHIELSGDVLRPSGVHISRIVLGTVQRVTLLARCRRDALDDVPLGEDTEDILLLFSFSLKYSFPNGSVVNPSNNMNSSQL
jgi:hypothetical protein